MATITVSHGFLQVTFTRREKVLGFLTDQRVALTDVRGARAEDPWKTLRGLRAPGLAMPRARMIGHWRHRGRRQTLVSVTFRQPAVRIQLADSRTDLLIGADEADAIAAAITRAVDGVRRG